MEGWHGQRMVGSKQVHRSGSCVLYERLRTLAGYPAGVQVERSLLYLGES